ncbi:ATP-binding cassette domain-containing protein [Anaeropeptidivorans aminofermentans]|uniref:ATP-binding cassette domain-containing protein n=1 Tax=Anaeropeptidivorans aminofermentans TaxID=2934315 RepID=UPI002024E362|nr:ATP-binding cassette domain-containing protein [Anaeropeptidivorans aminofermentans]
MSIEIINISKSFGNLKVLDNINMKFELHKTHCIMGPSGCGKSTLLNILMGIMEPDSGTVSGLQGKFISPVFQEERLCENLSALSNIRLASKERLDFSEVKETLEALLLYDCFKKPVRELSGGMKRRISLARAFLSKSDIFIFDEPFKGLDEDTKKKVMRYTKDICKDKTLIWVTHDPFEAEFIGGNIVRFSYGKS